MSIVTTNSVRKTVKFVNNCGQILVFALQDGEFWFTIGEYNTISGAKQGAKRKMRKLGYTLNEKELKHVKTA